jgi:hypothetical protein
VTYGSGGLSNPTDLAFANGRLLVTSADTNAVLQYDGLTGRSLGAFVRSGANGIRRPTDLVVHNGSLYVGAHSGDIHRYDPATGAFIDKFVKTHAGGITLPVTPVFGPDGNLFVAEYDYGGVLRYDRTTGDFIDEFIPANTGGLIRPSGIEFGADGNLYVVDFDGHSVLRFAGDTGEFIDAFIPGGMYDISGPIRPTFFGNHLFFSNRGSEIIRFEVISWTAFNVTLDSPSDSVVSVSYRTLNGEAIAGVDYTAASNTIHFAPGETWKTIVIPTIDDQYRESDETFSIVLSSPSQGHTISDATGIGSISDSDIQLPPIPGDFNDDGIVEQGDLDLVLLHWGQDGNNIPPTWFGPPPTGLVDQDELDAVLLNWGASSVIGNAAPVALALIDEAMSTTLQNGRAIDTPRTVSLKWSKPAKLLGDEEFDDSVRETIVGRKRN